MNYKLVNPNITTNYLYNLLQSRGIQNVVDYLNPTVKYLQSPHDLVNIDKAASLYIKTISKEDAHILIIVDSDNDGFTSAAIIYQYTKRIQPNIQIDYWLHNGKQHGLQDHIDKLLTENINYNLIILPDSSSNDIHYHDMLKDISIPCLVLDHHITDEQISDNALIVNNQLSPNYKNKELTGAGVVYQFCRYLDEQLNLNYANDYIDLAAWGIIGDMGDMTDMENRYIVFTGLSNINNYLFRTILTKQAYSITGSSSATWPMIIEKTNAISVAFYVVPLINSIIRVGTQSEKELLFLSFIDGQTLVPCNKRGAKGTFEEAAVECARIASNARTRQNKMIDDMILKVESDIFKYDLLENKVLFIQLTDNAFPPEINGLLAMKLSAKYHKPTIVAKQGADGFVKGSARGLNQSALRDFKTFLNNSNLFDYAQGHPNAFGCSIYHTNIDTFLNYANIQLADYDFGENEYDVNFVRYADDLDLANLITDLCTYPNIWGQGNPEPTVVIQNLVVTKQNIKIMGSNQDTVKITNNNIAYMKFKANDLIQKINNMTDSAILTVVGKTNLNQWMGTITPQIFIDQYDFREIKNVDF